MNSTYTRVWGRFLLSFLLSLSLSLRDVTHHHSRALERVNDLHSLYYTQNHLVDGALLIMGQYELVFLSRIIDFFPFLMVLSISVY